MHCESGDFDFNRPDTTIVIAEAGVNHNCDVQLGYKLVETAGAAGADAIKFQSYTAGKIATREPRATGSSPPIPRARSGTRSTSSTSSQAATSSRCSGTPGTSG